MIGDLEALFEFYEEGEVDDKEMDTEYEKVKSVIEELEFKKMLSGEEDQLSAMIDINPGAGGTESQDWAEMLLRMYIMWSESHNYKVREVNYQPGDTAGIKSATLEITGEFAYGYLKSEIGVHRLVRISPFDSGGRRHTSFASVFTYPIVDDSIEIEARTDDFVISTQITYSIYLVTKYAEILGITDTNLQTFVNTYILPIIKQSFNDIIAES